ncbi:NADHX dehydratase [Ascoidea rubescens DSM 1968]|uniref:ATP-dependent (S)-NAD(P)H-hydrate dehydratase n=1 Tax=Ascoidea rubescens DSM 1968 TaxID=1344418 RepID=A0A1D2VFK3_9ASCO|nr:Ribokinase-like protein [Ascoidea rubescens DSM 1968]ODV60362.1 Ribokinase-like protein [Ascoidea rubescens DSM 1968]
MIKSILSEKSSKELIKLAKKLVPPLSPNFYKGQAGRIVVVGGCEDYTGAPFFSAHSSAQFGADMVHIICEKEAAQVIKTYSPNLMVHPYLREHREDIIKLAQFAGDYNSVKNNGQVDELTDEELIDRYLMPKINSLLDRVHVVIVGPGFGRNKIMLKICERIILRVRELKKPLIVDADALYLVSLKPELIKGYERGILTPNLPEFKRLIKSLNIDSSKIQEDQLASELSSKLNGVVIFQKGKNDVITNGKDVLISDTIGSYKRCGGQGDTMTGIIGTILCWGEAYKQNLWKHDRDIKDDWIPLLSCFGGSVATRIAQRKAFKKMGRSMQASDLHDFVGESYNYVFESDEFNG